MPPDSLRLRRRIIQRNARRAARLARALRPLAHTRLDRDALRALAAARGDQLASPPLRAWLCQAEEALSFLRACRSPRRLFELAASGDKLAELVPRGRLDAGIVRRARGLSARLLRAALRQLPRALRPPAPLRLPARFVPALDLLGEVWPEARDEVLAQTHQVVPVVRRSTVSWSLKSQPGVSYINVRGKSLVDLADDLLHETAHHRLHGLEELAVLHRDDGEPRYWSPWRRALRPLQGILHAACTFIWRAALLARLLELPPRRLPVRRAWLRKELAFELRALRQSARDLLDAQRRGLLTPAGRRLVTALRRRITAI